METGQIMKGVRCSTEDLGLHPEGCEEPLENWDGHAET